MARASTALALLLCGCEPAAIELVIPGAARTLVLAAPPDVAAVQDVSSGIARVGAWSGDTPLFALFFSEDLATLAVSAGALGDAHRPFPPALDERVLPVGAAAWEVLDARPPWLEERLRPPCPPLTLDIVARPTTERGLLLLGRIDADHALARIDDAIVSIDARGNIVTLTATTARASDAFTDGERLWLLGGRYGAATGRMLEGRVDGSDALVRLAPAGWPAEAGGVRRVTGAPSGSGPRPELIVVTDLGWLLGYDGDRWRVRHQPRAPVHTAFGRLAWLAPERAALAPGLLEGPLVLEVTGSTVSARIDVAEPRQLNEPERVFALARGVEGDVLVGGDLGRVYRASAGSRQATLIAEPGGEIHALSESDGAVWSYGPLGLTRIPRSTGHVCPRLEGTSYSGTGRMIALDEAVILGGGDLIQRATVTR